jgi:hypothetical protein
VTGTGCSDRVASDPIELITDLVAAVERQLTREQIRAVASEVAGGRAKSRRLASALAERPGILADGRSPAPRAIGDLLAALRAAGAAGVSPPCCAGCGKQLRTWALEDRPELLTGEGHLAPLRAIPRLVDALHAADVAGIVRPACPGCHRVVRIDKPLDGVGSAGRASRIPASTSAHAVISPPPSIPSRRCAG